MSHRVLRAVLTCLLAVLLASCAYLTTYKRSVDLADKSIAIDVKQRVVFGQTRHSKDANHPDQNVVCAEPSPDALTVLGATGAISASNAQSGFTGNATSAFAESGASIGLRTQSIQLLRDAMYRLCEGYAGGAVDRPQFKELESRFQSTMMALLAIEQLTGPVVAGQAALTAAAASAAGAGAGDAQVTKAQDDLKTANENYLTAQASVDTAKSAVKKAQSDINDKDQEITKLTDDASAKGEKPDQQTLTQYQNDRKKLADAKATADDDLSDKQRRADDAKKAVSDAKAAVAQAKSAASSSASGNSQLTAAIEGNAKAQAGLNEAVVNIVQLTNSAFERASCVYLLTASGTAEVNSWCQSVLKGALEQLTTRQIGVKSQEDKMAAQQTALDQAKLTVLDAVKALPPAKAAAVEQLLQPPK
jgi:hypothetical protein